MRRSAGRLAAAALIGASWGAAWVTTAATPAPYDWRLPEGVAPPPVPADNPMSEAKVALGRRLFYDADLSINGTMSCATCHEQHRAFTEGNRSHPGARGDPGRRNVMALANLAWLTPLTWADPTQQSLEAQFMTPVFGEHPVEMGMAGKPEAISERLAGDPCYPRLFAAAFPGDGAISVPNIAKAVAAFERSMISLDSPYDRYRRGDIGALSPAAKRGLALFEGGRLDCAACHTAPLFTDAAFHNIGAYDPGRTNDRGLAEISNKAEDEGAIRTPSLRNVALSDPYLHDGSAATLLEAIKRHYEGPGPLRDPRLRVAGPDAAEMADIAVFLENLTDKGFIEDPRFALPKSGRPAS